MVLLFFLFFFCRPLHTAPGKVQLPLLMAIGPTQIRVEWVQPLVPNGIILKYEVYQSPSILLTNTTETGSQVVSGLSPSTMYQFFVNVCTAAGCTSSAYASVTTSESGEYTKLYSLNFLS